MGTAVGATQPDSVSVGGGSVWIEYGNGAPSTNYTGTSTIVQYSLSGAVQNTYSIPGSADGMKYDPATGLVWVLQNQDANSQITTINPVTRLTTTYTYGSAYTPVSGSRGFDDVAFLNGNVYLSFTNPGSTSDPVLVQLNSSTPSSPLNYTPILTEDSLLLTDPDSLKSTPMGGLMETGEGDGALTFIMNPGTGSQTATSLKLSAAPGTTIGAPDDAIYNTTMAGTFYLTATTSNIVYAVTATGLTPGSLFVNVGNEFGSVDPVTGVVTPIMSGSGLHGMDFAPAAVPEPSSIGLEVVGVLLIAVSGVRRKMAKSA